jgi:hypothetical protein
MCLMLQYLDLNPLTRQTQKAGALLVLFSNKCFLRFKGTIIFKCHFCDSKR